MPNESIHHYSRLIEIFNDCFRTRYNTVLVAGDDEPYYEPGKGGQPNKIVFAHGFFASALHETAHWCIAGEKRRQQFDYGYWYEPDGRNEQQQREFEQVERKPQALEWLFSLCAGFKFDVSVDNLSGVEVDRHAFREAVAKQLESYLATDTLPPRAKIFAKALCKAFNCEWPSCQMIQD